MKLIICRWVIISIALQVLILLFINNVYLVGKVEVKETFMEAQGKDQSGIEFCIPENAGQIKVSFDFSCAAYILDGVLEIVDLKNVKYRKTIGYSTEAVSFYKWLPDRNTVIYSQNQVDSGNSYIKISSFDFNTGDNHSYPFITNVPKGSEVTDIQLSTLTNIVYVKVRTDEASAKIFKFNILGSPEYLMTTGAATVIAETRLDDNLVFQDEENRVYVRKAQEEHIQPLAVNGRYALLGTDSEDRIFAGELDNFNRVVKIKVGKLNEKIIWEHITLSSPVAPFNIVISDSGTIYELEEDDNTVKCVQDSRDISYKGRFIGLTSGHIVTVDKGKLKFSRVE